MRGDGTRVVWFNPTHPLPSRSGATYVRDRDSSPVASVSYQAESVWISLMHERTPNTLLFPIAAEWGKTPGPGPAPDPRTQTAPRPPPDRPRTAPRPAPDRPQTGEKVQGAGPCFCRVGFRALNVWIFGIIILLMIKQRAGRSS